MTHNNKNLTNPEFILSHEYGYYIIHDISINLHTYNYYNANGDLLYSSESELNTVCYSDTRGTVILMGADGSYHSFANNN